MKSSGQAGCLIAGSGCESSGIYRRLNEIAEKFIEYDLRRESLSPKLEQIMKT